MLLADMQHSQPHMHLSQEVIFLSWDGKILPNFESFFMMLLSATLASFSTSSSTGINMLLCSYCTKTCNKKFGINCFFGLTSMDTSRH